MHKVYIRCGGGEGRGGEGRGGEGRGGEGREGRGGEGRGVGVYPILHNTESAQREKSKNEKFRKIAPRRENNWGQKLRGKTKRSVINSALALFVRREVR